MKYIIGFSGGIDSTFAAYKLKESGHDVILVHIKNTIDRNKCCQLPQDLMKISDKLGIRLEIVPVIEDFKQYIIQDFIDNYIHGLTPNPCIRCNEMIRFRILDEVRIKYGYDKVCTGHYADTAEIDGHNYLAKPLDEKKDQTYMLYRLANIFDNEGGKLLDNIEFPLKDFKKSDIKEIAQQIDLPSKDTDESQNICFIPDDDYPRFIKQNSQISYTPGKIIDMSGKYLGDHKGILNYTIGQRHGLNISSNDKLYINKIDPSRNEIIVGSEDDLMQKEIILQKHFIDETIYDNKIPLIGKIRYHHKGDLIENIEISKEKIKISFTNAVRAPTPGQHCVLYQNNLVIGGGIIVSTY